ncbi:MAG: type II toxin-antitoxin system VapC family toxin [Rubrivivax sp.]
MRLLLDTHIALWAVTGSMRLSHKAKQIILDADEVHVSAATLWEIAIKHGLGQGDMPVSSAQALQAFRDAGYMLLPVKPEHSARVEDLPGVHGDPLDRLLVHKPVSSR